jgi:small subunit ribosomal protein S4
MRMAPARVSKHKLSRRFGVDVYGTGEHALERRLGTPPGGAPRRRRRLSEYAQQLEEKQKTKAIYGVREGQFQRYFKQAASRPGGTGANLLQLLERRLDNVVYRLGWARSRPMARQLVSHGHVQVDGRRVNIPSYLVRPGEEVVLGPVAAQLPTVLEELGAHRPVPRWLARDQFSGRVVDLPTREDMNLPIDEDKIVAFYSR